MGEIGWVYATDTDAAWPVVLGEAYRRPVLHADAAAAVEHARRTYHPTAFRARNAGAVRVEQQRWGMGWVHRRLTGAGWRVVGRDGSVVAP